MEKTHIILYTVFIILVCNLFGFISSFSSFKMLDKYKIQKRKIRPLTFYKRLPLIFLNIFLLIIISCFGLYFFLDFINYQLSFNPIYILLQTFIIFVVDDVYFYFLHSFMHKNKYVLKKFIIFITEP